MQLMRKSFVLVLFVICSCSCAYAQIIGQKDYADNPEWISMMADSNVNYYEAVEAFNTYWEDREKPVQEKEVFGNYNLNKTKVIRQVKQREAKKYGIAYKKFKNWERESKPYVQPDGRILSATERLTLFNQEKKRKKM